MASQVPPVKNAEFTLVFSLFKNDGTIIANPGAYTKKTNIDGGLTTDITANVTEEDITYGRLSLVLSAAEMNGDAIWIMIKDDTSGCVPFVTTIYTGGGTITSILADTNELQTNQGNWLTATGFATPTNITAASGVALSATGADLILKNATFIQAIVAAINEFATYGLTALNTLLVTTGIKTATTAPPTDMALNSTVAKATDLATVAGYLDTEIASILADTNELQLNQGNWITATGFATPTNVTTAVTNIEAYGDAHWTASGSGAITWTYTVTDSSTGLPLDGVEVWITTDIAGLNVIASGVTNSFGIVTFYLDAGTVQVWRKKAGYDFINPDQEVIV
jgi:hypothetical protein